MTNMSLTKNAAISVERFPIVDDAISSRIKVISGKISHQVYECVQQNGTISDVQAIVDAHLWTVKHQVLQALLTNQETGDESQKPVANDLDDNLLTENDDDNDDNPHTSPESYHSYSPKFVKHVTQKLMQKKQQHKPTQPTQKPTQSFNINTIKHLDFPVPFQKNLVDIHACQGLKLNHGLYTQCVTKPRKNQTYCNTCLKQINANDNNMPNAGSIHLRMSFDNVMDFRDPKGKCPSHFTKVLNKLKLDKDTVISQLADVGIVLDIIHFATDFHHKKGRNKKDKLCVDEANLIQIKPQSHDNDEENPEEKPDETTEEEEKPEEADCENDCSQEEEEVLDVAEIKYKGKTYLKTDKNEILDCETYEVVGKYNEVTEDITFSFN